MYFKSNSVLIGFDTSAYKDSENDFVFLNFIQSASMSFDVNRISQKSIGKSSSITNQFIEPNINFSISYLQRIDFLNEFLFGFNINSNFSNNSVALKYEKGFLNKNVFFLFSKDKDDLIFKLKNEDYSESISALSFGRVYLNSYSINYVAGKLPEVSASFSASKASVSNLNNTILSNSLISNARTWGFTAWDSSFFPIPYTKAQELFENTNLNKGKNIVYHMKNFSMINDSKESLLPAFDFSTFTEGNIQSLQIDFDLARNKFNFFETEFDDKKFIYPIKGTLKINGLSKNITNGNFYNFFEKDKKFNLILGLGNNSNSLEEDYYEFQIENLNINTSSFDLQLNNMLTYSITASFEITKEGGLIVKQIKNKQNSLLNIVSQDSEFIYSSDGSALTSIYSVEKTPLPIITKSPESIILQKDQQTILTVEAYSPNSSQLNYCWRCDGVFLENSNSTSLKINGIQSSQGIYDVLVKNDQNNSVSSNLATVYVEGFPKILYYPNSSYSFLVGENQIISANAIGINPIYNWYKKSGNYDILINSGSSLCFSPYLKESSGNYFVEIKNLNCSDSLTGYFSINSLYSPIVCCLFLTSESEEICTGQAFCLTVCSETPDNLNYSWKRNEISIVDLDQKICGSKQQTICFLSASGCDAGYYSVQLSNENGSSLSSGFFVSIKSKPIISGYLEDLNKKIIVSNPFILPIYSENLEELNYFWYFSQDGSSYSLIQNQTKSFYCEQSATISSAGYYKSIASNQFGQSEVIFKIDIISAPIIINALSDISAAYNENFNLQFGVIGTEPFSFDWYFKNENDFSKIETTTEPVFFSKMALNKTGFYYALVKNEVSLNGIKTNIAKVSLEEVKPILINDFEIETTKSLYRTEPLSLSYQMNKDFFDFSFYKNENQIYSNLNGFTDFAKKNNLNTNIKFENCIFYFDKNSELSDSATYVFCIKNSDLNKNWDIVKTTNVLIKDSKPEINSFSNLFTKCAIGDDASFSISADGLPILFYDWTKSGESLSLSNSNVLTLENLEINDSGYYKVKISNPISEFIESDYFYLDISERPLIKKDIQTPLNVLIYSCNCFLQVLANGTQPLCYNWFKDGENISNYESPIENYISGKCTNKLTFINSNSILNGSYCVKVFNCAGEEYSSKSSVVVYSPPPPKFTKWTPLNLNLNYLSCALIIADVFSEAQTNFSWKKNGVSITPSSKLVVINNTCLCFCNIDYGSVVGNYSLIATSLYGSTNSLISNYSTNVTIDFSPEITIQPINVNAEFGTIQELSVTAIGPNLNYQWQKKDLLGQFLNVNSNVSAKNSTFKFILNLSIIGFYRVAVWSSDDPLKIIYSDEVVINGYKTLTLLNTNNGNLSLQKNEEDNVNISVSVNDTSIASYKWYKKIDGENNDFVEIFGQTSSNLTLYSVSKKDIGFYKVLISNISNLSLPTLASEIVRLDVNLHASNVLISTPDKTPLIGTNIKLKITTEGSGPFNYIVYEGSTIIGSSLANSSNSFETPSILIDQSKRFYASVSSATLKPVLSDILIINPVEKGEIQKIQFFITPVDSNGNEIKDLKYSYSSDLVNDKFFYLEEAIKMHLTKDELNSKNFTYEPFGPPKNEFNSNLYKNKWLQIVKNYKIYKNYKIQIRGYASTSTNYPLKIELIEIINNKENIVKTINSGDTNIIDFDYKMLENINRKFFLRATFPRNIANSIDFTINPLNYSQTDLVFKAKDANGNDLNLDSTSSSSNTYMIYEGGSFFITVTPVGSYSSFKITLNKLTDIIQQPLLELKSEIVDENQSKIFEIKQSNFFENYRIKTRGIVAGKEEESFSYCDFSLQMSQALALGLVAPNSNFAAKIESSESELSQNITIAESNDVVFCINPIVAGYGQKSFYLYCKKNKDDPWCQGGSFEFDGFNQIINQFPDGVFSSETKKTIDYTKCIIKLKCSITNQNSGYYFLSGYSEKNYPYNISSSTVCISVLKEIQIKDFYSKDEKNNYICKATSSQANNAPKHDYLILSNISIYTDVTLPKRVNGSIVQSVLKIYRCTGIDGGREIFSKDLATEYNTNTLNLSAVNAFVEKEDYKKCFGASGTTGLFYFEVSPKNPEDQILYSTKTSNFIYLKASADFEIRTVLDKTKPNLLNSIKYFCEQYSDQNISASSKPNSVNIVYDKETLYLAGKNYSIFICPYLKDRNDSNPNFRYLWFCKLNNQELNLIYDGKNYGSYGFFSKTNENGSQTIFCTDIQNYTFSKILFPTAKEKSFEYEYFLRVFNCLTPDVYCDVYIKPFQLYLNPVSVISGTFSYNKNVNGCGLIAAENYYFYTDKTTSNSKTPASKFYFNEDYNQYGSETLILCYLYRGLSDTDNVLNRYSIDFFTGSKTNDIPTKLATNDKIICVKNNNKVSISTGIDGSLNYCIVCLEIKNLFFENSGWVYPRFKYDGDSFEYTLNRICFAVTGNPKFICTDLYSEFNLECTMPNTTYEIAKAKENTPEIDPIKSNSICIWEKQSFTFSSRIRRSAESNVKLCVEVKKPILNSQFVKFKEYDNATDNKFDFSYLKTLDSNIYCKFIKTSSFEYRKPKTSTNDPLGIYCFRLKMENSTQLAGATQQQIVGSNIFCANYCSEAITVKTGIGIKPQVGLDRTLNYVPDASKVGSYYLDPDSNRTGKYIYLELCHGQSFNLNDSIYVEGAKPIFVKFIKSYLYNSKTNYEGDTNNWIQINDGKINLNRFLNDSSDYGICELWFKNANSDLVGSSEYPISQECKITGFGLNYVKKPIITEDKQYELNFDFLKIPTTILCNRNDVLINTEFQYFGAPSSTNGNYVISGFFKFSHAGSDYNASGLLKNSLERNLNTFSEFSYFSFCICSGKNKTTSENISKYSLPITLNTLRSFKTGNNYPIHSSVLDCSILKSSFCVCNIIKYPHGTVARSDLKQYQFSLSEFSNKQPFWAGGQAIEISSGWFCNKAGSYQGVLCGNNPTLPTYYCVYIFGAGGGGSQNSESTRYGGDGAMISRLIKIPEGIDQKRKFCIIIGAGGNGSSILNPLANTYSVGNSSIGFVCFDEKNIDINLISCAGKSGPDDSLPYRLSRRLNSENFLNRSICDSKNPENLILLNGDKIPYTYEKITGKNLQNENCLSKFNLNKTIVDKNANDVKKYYCGYVVKNNFSENILDINSISLVTNASKSTDHPYGNPIYKYSGFLCTLTTGVNFDLIGQYCISGGIYHKTENFWYCESPKTFIIKPNIKILAGGNGGGASAFLINESFDSKKVNEYTIAGGGGGANAATIKIDNLVLKNTSNLQKPDLKNKISGGLGGVAYFGVDAKNSIKLNYFSGHDSYGFFNGGGGSSMLSQLPTTKTNNIAFCEKIKSEVYGGYAGFSQVYADSNSLLNNNKETYFADSNYYSNAINGKLPSNSYKYNNDGSCTINSSIVCFDASILNQIFGKNIAAGGFCVDKNNPNGLDGGFLIIYLGPLLNPPS